MYSTDKILMVRAGLEPGGSARHRYRSKALVNQAEVV